MKIARILPSGVEIPVEDDFIWQVYRDKCIMCVYRPAVTLHEAPPKSRNPRWRDEPWTRWPVCEQHHRELHEMNLKVQLTLLTNQRIMYFPRAEEALKNHVPRND